MICTYHFFFVILQRILSKQKHMTIAIFGNAMKDNTLTEVSHILEFMSARGVNVVLSQELRQELRLREFPVYQEIPQEGDEPIDFAMSIGGDGTFLTTAAAVGCRDIPIIGINCGHLGFLADVQTRDVDTIMKQLVEGLYTIEQRSLLKVCCERKDIIMSPYALNEIAIMKQGMSSMISVEVSANGEFLHTYHADGLVLSTPTGSTAYNLSIGGPLLVPQTKGIILAPIATHSLTVRPLVVPDDWKFDLKVNSRYQSYMLSIDGRSQILNTDVTLHVEKAPYTIKLVQVGENSFLKSLRDKLNWGR